MWDVRGGRRHAEISPGLSQAVYTFVSPDGRYAVAFSGSPTLLDLREKKVIRPIPDLSRSTAVFSRDGRRLAGIDSKGDVVIWNVEDGTERLRYSPGPSRTTGFALSPDGRWLAAAMADHEIHFVSMANGQVIRTITLENQPGTRGFYMLAFGPRGRRLTVVSSVLKAWVIGNR